MEVAHKELLEALDEFEADLEVETILKKVKEELALDDTVTDFGEQLIERERQKGAAQATRAARATYFHQLCYPQHTCEWFVEGLDYCCSYWRYQFKRPDTLGRLCLCLCLCLCLYHSRLTFFPRPCAVLEWLLNATGYPLDW